MKARFGKVRAGSSEIAGALSAARGARNRATRSAAAQATEDRASVSRFRRKRAKEDRERERLMKKRIRVHMPTRERPRTAGRTPRKLFYRAGATVSHAIRLAIPSSGSGARSIHFAVVARGFASRTGRRWRGGEGERAALYITREDGLEGGEAGWWSNIAEDRNELVAFHRASEALEKHDRKNANVYVAEIISLPASLTAPQRRQIIKNYCRHFEERGLPFTVGMHEPDANGDGRNYHCHIVYSLRPAQRLGAYDWSFAISKLPDVNTPDAIRHRRRLAVDAINETLVAAGSLQRYTHLSNRARGLGPAAAKQGQEATWIARRIAGAELQIEQLSRLGRFVDRLREGSNAISKLASTRDTVGARVSAVLAAHTTMAERHLQALAGMRAVIKDRLQRLRATATPNEPGPRLTAARTVVRTRLSAASARGGVDDSLNRGVVMAGQIAADRIDQRRRLDKVQSRIAIPLPPLGPVRDTVANRLQIQRMSLLDGQSNVDAILLRTRERVAAALRGLLPSADGNIGERLSRVADHITARRNLESAKTTLASSLATMPDLAGFQEGTHARLKQVIARIGDEQRALDGRLDAVGQRLAAARVGPSPSEAVLPNPTIPVAVDGTAAMLPPFEKLSAKDARSILRQRMNDHPSRIAIEKAKLLKAAGQELDGPRVHIDIEQRNLLLQQEKDRRKRIVAAQSAAGRDVADHKRPASAEIADSAVEGAPRPTDDLGKPAGIEREAAGISIPHLGLATPPVAATKVEELSNDADDYDPWIPRSPRRGDNGR